MSVILYAALCGLLLVCAVLLLPFLAPVRAAALPLLPYLALPSYVLLALCALLLCSSGLELRSHRALAASAARGGSAGSEYFSHAARAMEAELQCVLSAAAALLLAVAARVSALHRQQATLLARYTAMEKQAKGAAAAYLSTLPAASTAAAAAAPPPPPSAAPSVPASSSSAPSVSAASFAELKAEKERLAVRVAALERQAHGASEAFLQSDGVRSSDSAQQVEVLRAQLRQSKEDNARLQTALEDYELVLGGAKKKKV